MPDIIIQHLNWIQHFSYLGAYILMSLSGHVIPIPQDISLISMGYLSALGYMKIVPVAILGALAATTSDAFLFYLSHHGSRFAPDPEKYSHMWVYKFANHHMHNNTILAVVLMRFVTGFRFLSPVMGAYIKVPFKKYIIANFISALIFGPFFVLLGYTFHTQITYIIDMFKSIEHIGSIAFVVVALLILGYLIKNRYNNSASLHNNSNAQE
jgi:membrane protein DedA with SNARE-associated domain